VVKKTEGEAKSIELRAHANAKSTEVMAAADAKKITLTGTAEASAILQKGEATATAYNKQVAAMGADNFAKFKITEEIAQGRVKITPDVLIGGGGGSDANGPISALLGLKLMEQIGQSSTEKAIAEQERKEDRNKKNDTK
jgi:hypothetical protein